MKIFAVVVTYNRLSLLKQVVTALQNQTIPLHKIIVINNNSTDGTKEWLTTQDDLQVIEQPNTGSSGGYHTGVRYAYEQKADWIWMMDDDALPRIDCLEKLLQYQQVSHCLQPVHLDEKKQMQDEERWLDPSSCNLVSGFNTSYKNGKKIWYRNTGSFEGMLVSALLVHKIGYPDVRFFIMHDDVAYAYQANKYTNVAVVADAVMQRLPLERTVASHLRTLYFEYRNLWLLQEYVANDLKGFDGYRQRRVMLKFLYAVYEIWNCTYLPAKWKAYKTLYRAYRHYKQKKSGNTF